MVIHQACGKEAIHWRNDIQIFDMVRIVSDVDIATAK